MKTIDAVERPIIDMDRLSLTARSEPASLAVGTEGHHGPSPLPCDPVKEPCGTATPVSWGGRCFWE